MAWCAHGRRVPCWGLDCKVNDLPGCVEVYKQSSLTTMMANEARILARVGSKVRMVKHLLCIPAEQLLEYANDTMQSSWPVRPFEVYANPVAVVSARLCGR